MRILYNHGIQISDDAVCRLNNTWVFSIQSGVLLPASSADVGGVHEDEPASIVGINAQFGGRANGGAVGWFEDGGCNKRRPRPLRSQRGPSLAVPEFDKSQLKPGVILSQESGPTVTA